jgi:hypothetical protein
MCVKDNQANLRQDIEDWFVHGDQQYFQNMTMNYHETVSKTSGRVEMRCVVSRSRHLLPVSEFVHALTSKIAVHGHSHNSCVSSVPTQRESVHNPAPNQSDG